jgi:uncharacterized protein YecE (DUF72 family)
MEATAREFIASLAPLGDKLGCVLLQVPEFIERDEEALAGLTEVAPRNVPFACELHHGSWRGEEVAEALAACGGTVCLREEEGTAPPALPPGPVAYVRLKADRYRDDARQALRELFAREASTRDVYVFARHKGVPADDPHTGVALARWLLDRS